MQIEQRIQSLRQFVEERERQLTLPMGDGECDESDRQDGGRFGPGNDCGGSGGGARREAETLAAIDEIKQASRGPVSIVGRAGDTNTANGFPAAWSSGDRIEHTGGIPGAPSIGSITDQSPAYTKDVAARAGIKSVSQMLDIGAANAKGAEVEIESDSNNRSVIGATIPVSRKDGSKIGNAIVEVILNTSDPDDTSVYYGYFQRDTNVESEIRAEKNASGGSGASRTEAMLGAAIIDLMTKSMATAEKAGIKRAKTNAAGMPGGDYYQGYRLWGRFGMDGPVNNYAKAKLREDIKANPDLLTPAGRRELATGRPMTLQRILQTKAGEKWWAKNGHSIDLSFDFTAKRSIGYKKYKAMIKIAERARKRGSRDFLSFANFVARSYVSTPLSRWSPMDDAERRAGDCGTGAGGFQPGNACGGLRGREKPASPEKPLAKEVGGMRDSSGYQTDAARKLYSIGMKERSVASMIESLGGDPGKTSVKISINRLNMTVKDSSGNDAYFIQVRTSGARIFAIGKDQQKSPEDIRKIESIVSAAMPKIVKGKTSIPFSVKAYSDPAAYEEWKKEEAARYKAVEDKYRFSPLLPPHQRPKDKKKDLRSEIAEFIEARNCGTGTGGFQKGNTCGGQAAVDAAAGAAKGLAVGAGTAAGQTAGFLPAVATGAATGAAIGIVKGLYDNKMRPTRAAKAIAKIGSTDEHVASIVKSLGGSPKSVAEADGPDTVAIRIKDADGKSSYDVTMTKDSVTIRPVKGRITSEKLREIKALSAEAAGKNYRIVVQNQPVSVLSRVIKEGYSLAVDATYGLVAGAVIPIVPAIAGTAVEVTTGIDVEQTKVIQLLGEKVLGNIKKRP